MNNGFEIRDARALRVLPAVRHHCAAIVLLSGSLTACPDDGDKCSGVSVVEMYCPALERPFKQECTGIPRELFTGDVVDQDHIVVLGRDTILFTLEENGAMSYEEWEDIIFSRRAQTFPAREFECKQSIGAVVKNIDLKVEASRVSRIELSIGPGYCEHEMKSCTGTFNPGSPYVETFRGNNAADDYLSVVVSSLAGRGDKKRLRLVTATYVGNVNVRLEGKDSVGADLQVPVGETLNLGLSVDAVGGGALHMSTGSAEGPLEYTLSQATKSIEEVETALRQRRGVSGPAIIQLLE